MRHLCVIVCLPLLLLAGCAQKTMPPATSYTAPVPPVTQLRGKSVAVFSPLSLKAVLKLDSGQMLARYKAGRQAEGEEQVPLMDIHLINKAPSYLSIGARYPYLIADALSQGGVSAQPGDTLDLPESTFKDASIDEIRAKLRDMGFDYILVVGLERPAEKGAKMYIRDEHYGKTLAADVATFGLSPVRTHTYGVHYARDYELQSTAPGSQTIRHTLVTDYRYDATKSILAGFSAGQRMMRDMEQGQIQEVPAALTWLGEVELRGLSVAN